LFHGWGLVGPRGKKKDRLGWKEGMGEGLFWFFLFPFQILTQNFLKIFKQTFDHTINQNPCIQHDAQTLGFSKLINYHFIYIKGKFNYSNSLTLEIKFELLLANFK
jgi:hypothetical protein